MKIWVRYVPIFTIISKIVYYCPKCIPRKFNFATITIDEIPKPSANLKTDRPI